MTSDLCVSKGEKYQSYLIFNYNERIVTDLSTSVLPCREREEEEEEEEAGQDSINFLGFYFFIC